MIDGLNRAVVLLGQSEYPHLEPAHQLPGVKKELDTIGETLTTSFGFVDALPQLRLNATADNIRRDLGGWLADPARNDRDVLLLYFTGHGQVGTDGRHYLLTSDSHPDNLVGTALPTDTFASLLSQSPIQHCLVIIDTCYAEEGALDINAVLARMSWTRHTTSAEGSGIYTIAAARPYEQAQVNTFAESFAAQLMAESMGGANQQYLDIPALISAVNIGLEQQKQSARYSVTAGSGISPVLRNPRFKPHLPTDLDIATQRRLVDAGDLEQYWSPRARGVSVAAETGNHFVGRANLLAELTQWLADGEARAQGIVVTGNPGSGKSAVLARLFLLSDKELSAKHLTNEMASSAIPEGIVAAAVYCRRKSLAQVVAEISIAIGHDVLNFSDLIDLLASNRHEASVIILDGVDEADDAHLLIQELILPIARAPRGVKFLLGARRYLISALKDDFTLLDVDEPRYADLDDIEGYASKMLSLPSDDGNPSRLIDEDRLTIARLAREISTHAYPSFLIARLAARAIAAAPSGESMKTREWRFPETVEAAMEADLDRYGDERGRVVDLLRPLAFARGGGLPWTSVWAETASALSGLKAYADTDIAWLMEHAGGYVVQAIEGGRSVYRLYHQALADYLRVQGAGEQDLRSLVTGLEATVPRGSSDQLLWWSAPVYVVDHLAVHAAEAGVLEHLLRDDLFVAITSPAHMLRAISVWKQSAEKRNQHDLARAECYEQAFHVLEDASPAERISYLALAALRNGSSEFQTCAEELNRASGWIPRVAKPRGERLRSVVEAGANPFALSIVDLGGIPGVVLSRSDGYLACYSMSAFAPRWTARPWSDHKALCMSASLGGHFLACANSRGEVAVLDAETGMILDMTPPLGGAIDVLRLVRWSEHELKLWIAGRDGRCVLFERDYFESRRTPKRAPDGLWVNDLLLVQADGDDSLAVVGGGQQLDLIISDASMQVELHSSGTSLAGTADGACVAAGDEKGRVTLVDVKAMTYRQLEGASSGVVYLGFVNWGAQREALVAIDSGGRVVAWPNPRSESRPTTLVEGNVDWAYASYVQHAALLDWGGGTWALLVGRDGTVYELPLKNPSERGGGTDSGALPVFSAAHRSGRRDQRIVVQDVAGTIELIDADTGESTITAGESDHGASPIIVVHDRHNDYAVTLGEDLDRPLLIDLETLEIVDQAWLSEPADLVAGVMLDGEVYLLVTHQARLVSVDFRDRGEIEGRRVATLPHEVKDMVVMRTKSAAVYLIANQRLYRARIPVKKKRLRRVKWARDLEVTRVAVQGSLGLVFLLSSDGYGRVYSAEGQAVSQPWTACHRDVAAVRFIEACGDVFVSLVDQATRVLTLRHIWGGLAYRFDFGSDICDSFVDHSNRLVVTTVGGPVILELKNTQS